MNFWHFLKVVKSRKWVILGVVAVTLLVVAIAAPKPKVVYEATAYMSPTPQVMQNGNTTATSTAPAGGTDREIILSNLIILARGGDVYQRALDFLALPEDEQRRLVPDLPSYRQIQRIDIAPGKRLEFKEWGDVLSVDPVYNRTIGEKGTTTDIINITVNMENGDAAPYLANAVGYAFSQAFQDKSREDFRTYAKFLESSKEEAKKRLQALQAQIVVSKRGYGVVEVTTETQSAINALATLKAEQDRAEADDRQASAVLMSIDSQLARQPAVITRNFPADMNPTVARLKQELANSEAELRMLSRRYKPGHEIYKAAQAQVTMIKERIAREGSTFGASALNEVHQELAKQQAEARADLAKARAKLASISASVAKAQAKVGSIGGLAPQLAELQRDFNLTEKSYNDLSEKYAQVTIAEQESTKTGSIVPFGWARVAVGPVVQGPTKKALLLYGLLLSLMVGVMAAVWLDSIDNKLRTAQDVEKLLELPVIGRTPELTATQGMLPKLTHLYPLSPMAESYRILRTNVLFELRDNPFKTLMIATSRPGQGATTTICNLAISLAQAGKKVILIDADMRKPSLHRFFKVPNEAGLSTLLQGQGPLTDAFQKTEIENLIVVPGGPRPVNPSELLGSQRMQDVVKKLEDHCDLVLFDAPSTVVFSDGAVLASWVDAVLMVIAADQIPRGTEIQTRDLLRRAHANIVGVVVNRMSPENVDNCQFHMHYYPESMQDIPVMSDGRRRRERRDRAASGSSTMLVGEATSTEHRRADGTDSAADDDERSPFPD